MARLAERPTEMRNENSSVEDAVMLRRALGRLIERLDPPAMNGGDAARLVEELAGIERLAQTGKVLAVRRATEAEGWRRQGDRSAAEWLARETKSSVREADRLLETSKRLADQPLLESAMRRGELNVDQATEVSEAAAADPTSERRLVQAAGRESLAGLRQAASRTKAAARGDDALRHERARRNRHLRSCLSGDGEHRIEGSNTASAGAIIEAALKPFHRLAFEAARASGRRESFEAYRADALEMLAAASIGVTPTCLLTTFGQPGSAASTVARESSADSTADASPRAVSLFDAVATTDGTAQLARSPHDSPSAPTEPLDRGDFTSAAERSASRPAATSHSARPPDGTGPARPTRPATPRSRPGPPGPAPPGIRLDGPPATVIPWDPGEGVKLPGGRVKIIGRIDVPALARGSTRAGETSDLVGLGPAPVTAIRDLIIAADPFLAAVLTDGHDIAAVTHLGRNPTAHQRTALEWRDAHCIVEGCTRSFCDIDHNTGWTITRDTRLDDLALLCGHHHRLKTAGWHLEPAPPGQRRRLLAPDHPDHPDQRRTSA